MFHTFKKKKKSKATQNHAQPFETETVGDAVYFRAPEPKHALFFQSPNRRIYQLKDLREDTLRTGLGNEPCSPSRKAT